jgi:hypothetical protein
MLRRDRDWSSWAAAMAALCLGCVQPKEMGTPATPGGDDGAADLDGEVVERADAAIIPSEPDAAFNDGTKPDLAWTPDGGAEPDLPPSLVDAGPTKADTGSVLATLGASCQRGGDCASGFCADGVCCNQACSEVCAACAQSGNLGTCLPVTGPPQGTRSACPGSGACAGSCDGKDPTACHFPGAAVACGTASCSAGVATPAATCDGHGACATPKPVTCAPDPCDGSACGQCSDSRPCASGFQCTGGKCMPKLDNGAQCQNDGQCKSGQCADGICCNRACGGACEACNVSGKVGTCSFLTGTVCRATTGACDVAETCDGQSSACPSDRRQSSGFVCRSSTGPCDQAEACDGASVACPPDALQPAGTACRAASGLCDVTDTCNGTSAVCPDVKKPEGTSCRAGSCSNDPGGSTATPAAKCDAGGACVNQGSGGSCGTYLCGGNQCKMTCTSTSECFTGNYCDPSSHCVACPKPSSANLLSNPGFNQDLSAWIPTLDQWALDHGADVLYNQLDSKTCTSSGSVQLRVGDSSDVFVSQCVPAISSGSYSFGGTFLASKVSETVLAGGEPWNGYCGLIFYGSMTDCAARTGQLGQKYLSLHDRAISPGVWNDFGVSWFSPVGTGAIAFQCEMLDDGAVNTPYILVDRVYLRTSGSGF